MGAPAISTRTRPARPAAKPRRAPAKPRTATKPRASTATARPKPKARAAAKPRARAAAPASHGIRGLTPATAVGRTAVAVVSLPDCGLMMSMTRSRLWIGVLGVLLGGIVALNVWGLSLTASGSSTAAKIDELQRQNSVLRGRTATRLTNGRVEAAAADLGLSVPAAGDVTYLKAKDGDAARAASRISSGAIALVEAIAPVTTEPLIDPAAAPVDDLAPTDPVVPAVDPATAPVTADPAAVDPTVTDPAVSDPVATDPVTTDPVDPTTDSTTDAAGAYAP
jgi:hypothetical protein